MLALRLPTDGLQCTTHGGRRVVDAVTASIVEVVQDHAAGIVQAHATLPCLHHGFDNSVIDCATLPFLLVAK
ncbi:hypothetical protein AQ915_21750 [Burkholderia pseudomallei]|nr:hypothetical protein SZ29_15380 [Burkholderia pseudomallei]ONC29434.1 hypothetical protein AQ915_21750 [Burkholderia pseudomallei]